MTARQERLVRESFAAVQELAEPLAVLFYGRLFERAPETRRMFHEDIRRQGAKLMEMLAAVTGHLGRLEELNPVLRAMGQRHAAYGVLPHHYDLVEEALLWSLGHALEEGFDAEHREAWREVVRHIARGMQRQEEGAGLDC